MSQELAPQSGNLRAYPSDVEKIRNMKRGKQTLPDVVRMIVEFYEKKNKGR